MTREVDAALLRRFEPVLRYTQGESFFPFDVERYVNACSLWIEQPGRGALCLIPHGGLSLADLGQPPAEVQGTVHYLKLVDPLSIAELATYALNERQVMRSARQLFRAGRGRLARVGYISRFVDAVFSLGLLLRGRVPGDAAAAAALAYRRLRDDEERHRYYGRVVCQQDWIVLQYWFFYPFNNWRSGFFGANDHEADWEMICVYLARRGDDEIVPEWVAYAAHDYAGDDLRRRWDDPELEKVGEHPVCYVGAGSHASYFSRGEYLTELELRWLAPLSKSARRFRRVWRAWLRQYYDDMPATDEQPVSNIFRIPFVDYARGDGLAIGPQQKLCWGPPELLNPTPAWVSGYRGLWGLYTRDPFAGENAPAGPMYQRNGTIRRSWYDPVGWAGLDKVTPQHEVLAQIREQQAVVATRREARRQSIEMMQRELQDLGVEAAAMRGQRHLRTMYAAHQQDLRTRSTELARLQAQQATDQMLEDALERYGAQLTAGVRDSPRAHLRRPQQPTTNIELRFSRLADLWAALSIGVMLVSLIGLILFARHYLLWGLVAIVALFVFLEASFRGRLIRLVTGVTVGLATTAALVMFYEFFWPIVIAGVLVAGLYILWENLRELWT